MIVMGLAGGVVLLIIAACIWLALRWRQAPLTATAVARHENLLLGFFTIAYVGTWLSLMCGVVWLRGQGYIPIGLNLFTGALLSLIPGVLGLYHWFLGPWWDSRMRQSPEETIGGGFIGLGFLFGSVLLGASIGLVGGGFWG